MDDMNQLRKLRSQGFYCSQIILQAGLEQMGKSNPDLIRAMHGLVGGLGFSGELCGALSGGACLLGLYAGRGTPDQEEDPRLYSMTEDLVSWFKTEVSRQFGGIRCDEILGENSQNKEERCPMLTLNVLQKVNELLLENGFEISGEE